MIPVTSHDDYAAWRKAGRDPLVQDFFAVDIRLRRDLQRRLFRTNEAFYRYCWDFYPHYCMECMRRLPEYSSVYVSHILTRGAHPDMAHDPRNVRILCARHHEQYEHRTTRRTMRIYEETERIAEMLRNEYQGVQG